MNKKKSIAIVLILFVLFNGCHQPDELLPPVSRDGINSIIATFEDGTGEFIGTISEDSSKIIIPIPYFYPESSNNRVTQDQLKKMRVKANLDDNVMVSPSLLFMDLTKDNVITVTDQRGEKKEYTVRGEIRKSSAAQIVDFGLSSVGISGVINESSKVISLISVEEIEPAFADITLSHHATVSPDPTEVELDYNGGVQLTVTAHDGVTQSVYTVRKEVPDKLPYGIRSGSAKLMFAKQLEADLGITADHITGGIAVAGKHVVLNTRGQNSIYIDAKTGEKVGEVELGTVKDSFTNFYSTADDDANILINNLTSDANNTFDGSVFKVWKLSSVNSSPELIIEWDTGGMHFGRKLSIQGSLDSDAIITAPVYGSAEQRFAKWIVTGGVLTSQTPEVVTMSGLVKGWTTNADVVYTSGTDLTSDYFAASYSDNTFAWVDGQTNTVSNKLDPISTNYIPNAVDYIEFNNAKYTALNWVNSFSWGAADMVWLLDVSSNATFSGDLNAGTVNAVVWETPKDTYGANAIESQPVNTNGTGDVALAVSDNGYYMYLYFMFTNGYIVGYQFDNIDM